MVDIGDGVGADLSQIPGDGVPEAFEGRTERPSRLCGDLGDRRSQRLDPPGRVVPLRHARDDVTGDAVQRDLDPHVHATAIEER